MFKNTLLAIIYLMVAVNVLASESGADAGENNSRPTKNDEFFARFLDDNVEKNVENKANNETKNVVIYKEISAKSNNGIKTIDESTSDKTEVNKTTTNKSNKDNTINKNNSKNTNKSTNSKNKSVVTNKKKTNNNSKNTKNVTSGNGTTTKSVSSGKSNGALKNVSKNTKTSGNSRKNVGKNTSNSTKNNVKNGTNRSNNQRKNQKNNNNNKTKTLVKNKTPKSNNLKNSNDNMGVVIIDKNINTNGNNDIKTKEGEIRASDLVVREEELPLKLYNLIDLALERNLDTKQAYINVKLSEYDLMIARSNFYPSIAGAGSLSAVDGDRYDDARKTISGDISLRYNVFAFGKYMFNLNAVKHSLNAMKYEENQKIQDIIFSVVENYYNLLALNAERDVVVDSRELSYETYKSASLKYKLGIVPLVDKLKANTAYSQKKVEVIRAENEIKKQKANLNVVLNLEPEYVLFIENPEINVEKSNKNIDYFLKEAKLNRPDLKSLKEVRKQKEQELNQAKTEFLPEINLSGSVGVSRDISRGSDKKNIKEESISLGVNVPIFDGFSDVARVKRKKNEIKMLDLQIEELEKQISNEVWSCYQDFNTNQVAYLASKDLLESAEENAKLNFGMYKNGKASILEVLDSQNQLKEAKLEFVKSKYNWMIYRIKLLKTIGKMNLDNIINIKEW